MSKSAHKLKLKLIAEILTIEDEKMLKLIYKDLQAAHSKPRKAKNKDKVKDKAIKFHADSAAELQNNTSQEPQNAYTPWTTADDQRLLELHREGHSVIDIATTFARRKGSIESRLRKLNSKE